MSLRRRRADARRRLAHAPRSAPTPASPSRPRTIPWRDNGVKIFSREGRKLPDDVEAEIERRIEEAPRRRRAPPSPSRRLARATSSHLVWHAPPPARRPDGRHRRRERRRLRGRPRRRSAAAGARSSPGAWRPTDGTSTRAAARSTPRRWPAPSSRRAPTSGSRSTATRTGSSWRTTRGRSSTATTSSTSGRIELIREGAEPAAVVGTVMSNCGLERALAERGVAALARPSATGTSSRRWRRRGALLGGEPSGHLIRADLTTTGDGTLTGLHLAALVAASGKTLSAQPRFVHTPQLLRNVRVKERVPFDADSGLRRRAWRAPRSGLAGAGGSSSATRGPSRSRGSWSRRGRGARRAPRRPTSPSSTRRSVTRRLSRVRPPSPPTRRSNAPPEMERLAHDAVRTGSSPTSARSPRSPRTTPSGAAALARALIEREPPEDGRRPGELLDLLFDEAIPRASTPRGPATSRTSPGAGCRTSAVADLIAAPR